MKTFDWTVDPQTNRSNSSPEFYALQVAIAEIILNGAHDLLAGHTETVAGIILARLAHKHGLRPDTHFGQLFDHYQCAVQGSMPFTRGEWTLHGLLRNGSLFETRDGTLAFKSDALHTWRVDNGAFVTFGEQHEQHEVCEIILPSTNRAHMVPWQIGDWTTLSALREGAIFTTRDGIRAVKSEYRDGGKILSYLLASGECAHFSLDPGEHNATEVREIILP